MSFRRLAPCIALLAVACGTDYESGSRGTPRLDLTGPLDSADTYWNLPFPSDLRLTADGKPDFTGFPNRHHHPVVDDLLSLAGDRKGFPVNEIAWFSFTAPIPAQSLDDVVMPWPCAPALLIDIDPDSPERLSMYPLVIKTLAEDEYSKNANLVAVAPVPGTVLRPHTRYAYLIQQELAPGFTRPVDFQLLVDGKAPAGDRGAAAKALYEPLWPALADAGIQLDGVLAATVFTTGDEVSVLRQRSEAIRAQYDAVLANVQVDPDDGATQDGFCELTADMTVPQFQQGEPPFDTMGRFAFDEDGVPIKVTDLTVPVHLAIPNGEMPTDGWPLFQYFHGSGGASFDIIDLGPSLTSDGDPQVGRGPAWVLAPHGIASVGAALPLNPERLPGASDTEYLNINNLGGFPYTFQQGVIEQRLLLDALLDLRIPEAALAACPGVTLPSGVHEHKFDPQKLVAGGHSMGGMYTNMIGAVEERYRALTPFGAGGMWPLMILDTEYVVGARDLLAGFLGADATELSYAHPALALLGIGWEIADPINSMARLARRPLDGFPARHVYQPVGLDDVYFPNAVFDAAALSYGNQEAGDEVWPEMQDSLATNGLDGLIDYPVRGNREYGGGPTTSVVVQYHDDGIRDAHQIFRQLDAVKYQYACFLETTLSDGVPTVPAPAALDAACPHGTLATP